jgi:hypothetical protein
MIYIQDFISMQLAFIVTGIRAVPGFMGYEATKSLIIPGQGNLPGVKLGDALERIDLRNGLVGA